VPFSKMIVCLNSIIMVLGFMPFVVRKREYLSYFHDYYFGCIAWLVDRDALSLTPSCWVPCALCSHIAIIFRAIYWSFWLSCNDVMFGKNHPTIWILYLCISCCCDISPHWNDKSMKT
jgi:hypothetical protein